MGILFCSSELTAASASKNTDHVVLQLKWQHQFQFAGYYAAIAQGYYREAGLDVELREALPGLDPVKTVLDGDAQFGVGTSELLLLRAGGKDVVVLAAIFQHSPLVLLARRSEKISDLHDLVGLPVMIEPQSAELFAYFKVEGVDPKRLVIEHHTFRVEDLIRGQVSAMSAYSTDEPFILQQAGVEYLAFTPRAGGIDFYGDNLFTTESQIRQHPERVRAFREASLRGWDYALAHPQEIVELILNQYSSKKTREHLLFEADHTAQLMHPGLIEVGHMNPGRWRHIADTYADFNMAPRNFNLQGFLYDPDPLPDVAWVYWTMGGTLLFSVAMLGWALPMYRLNRSLRHEIAERRKIEEDLRQAKDAAESANRAKSHYLAIMAHEVRTPIGGIIGIMQLIRSEPLSGEQKENLELIENSAESLLKLITHTLDYSKLEAGCLDVELIEVTPRKFIREICELFRASAQAKGIQLQYETAASVPLVVITDPTRLRQVLTNLVSNAIKFTAQGGVEVVLDAQLIENDKTASTNARSQYRLRFTVKDTGEGIPPEALGRLFSPYAQADPSVSRRYGGTGLGLSISRGVAQLLGGDITVESTPGKGSNFTVEIIAEASTPPSA